MTLARRLPYGKTDCQHFSASADSLHPTGSGWRKQKAAQEIPLLSIPSRQSYRPTLNQRRGCRHWSHKCQGLWTQKDRQGVQKPMTSQHFDQHHDTHNDLFAIIYSPLHMKRRIVCFLYDHIFKLVAAWKAFTSTRSGHPASLLILKAFGNCAIVSLVR